VFELLLIWIVKGRSVQISSNRGFESNAYHAFDIMKDFWTLKKIGDEK
jgi:hypothetical protein